MDLLAVGIGTVGNSMNGQNVESSKNNIEGTPFSLALEGEAVGDELKPIEQVVTIKMDHLLDRLDHEVLEEDIRAMELLGLQILAEYLQQPMEHVEQLLEVNNISIKDLVSNPEFEQLLIQTKDDAMLLLQDEEQLESMKQLLKQANTLKLMYGMEENLSQGHGQKTTDELLAFLKEANLPMQYSDQNLQNKQKALEIEEDRSSALLEIQSDNIIEEAVLPSTLNENGQIEQDARKIVNNNNSRVFSERSLEVARQIINKIEYTHLKELNKLNMELQPKSLGRLAIELVERNGDLLANIKVESEEVKELVNDRLGELKEALEQQGLSVQGMEVGVGSQSEKQHMERQKQKASKRIQDIISKHLEEQQQESLDTTIQTEMDVKV